MGINIFDPRDYSVPFVLIVPEERYLKNKFGGVYLEYTASLRRWFGRKRTNPY